ncbi:hypothetical protein CJF30_00001398 [Rutstroemia sp. NJR-2017a BBW]|nr:hypothetical protein CJF30_00001398 [Rutstroemia sp. NJR-2017a BBW]
MFATRNKNHCLYWCESLTAKITGNGKVFGREEFDKILGQFSVNDPFHEPVDLSGWINKG